MNDLVENVQEQAVEITAEMLQKSYNEKIKSLPVDVQESIIKSLNEVEQIQNDNSRIIVKINKTLQHVLKITDEVSPVAACKSGCAACCHNEVIISADEAAQIAAKIGRTINITPYTSKAMTIKRLAEVKNTRCTFLSDENTCSIYEFRPLICKVRMNISEYPQICEQRGNGPMFDYKPLWKMQGEYMKKNHISVKDIRDFFATEEA